MRKTLRVQPAQPEMHELEKSARQVSALTFASYFPAEAKV